MSIRLQPLNDRILVKPVAPEEVTATGVILLERSQLLPDKGLVCSVGLDCSNAIKRGDTVIYDVQAGVNIDIGDEHYLMLRERDIAAIESND